MKKLLILGLILVAFAAHAGQDRGGADTIQCNVGLFSNFKGSQAILADVVGIDTLYDTKYYDWLSLEQARVGVLTYIKKYHSADFDELSEALRKVIPFKTTEMELPNLNTGYKPKLLHRLFGCGKQQLAIQNLETGEVLVYSSLLSKLSVIERVLLEIHEAFISIASKKTGDLDQREHCARTKVADYFRDINFREVAPGENSILGTALARKIVSIVTNSNCWSCSLSDVGGIHEGYVRQYLEKAGFPNCPRSATSIPKGDIRLYEYVVKISGINTHICHR